MHASSSFRWGPILLLSLSLTALAAARTRPMDPAARPVHRHILPARALDQVLQRGELRMLSWGELTRQLEKGLEARRKAADATHSPTSPGKPEGPTHRFSTLSLQATQEADGDDVRVVLRAQLEASGNGQQLVPLVGAGPTPETFSARLGGKKSASAQLVRVEGGWGALVPGPGSWALELVAWVPVTQQGHLRSVRVAVPPVPGATGEILLPGDDLEVFLDPAPETERLEAPEGRTRTRAQLPPGTAFQAHWFPRDAGLQQEERSEDEPSVPSSGLEELGPKIFATWSQTLVLGQARMDALVRLRLQVHRAPISSVRILTRGVLENLECKRDPRLVESVRSLPDGLEVQLRGSRQGTLDLDLSYRHRDPEGRPSFELTVPRLQVEGAWSERSYLWVGRSTNVEIHPQPRGKVEAATGSDLPHFPPHPDARDPLMRYRLEGPEAALHLQVERYPDAPVTTRVVDLLEARTELTPRGRATTRVTLHVRDWRRAPLLVQLPAGAVATGFWRDGKRIPQPPESEEGYRLPLQDESPSQEETVEVALSYQQELAGGPLDGSGRRSLGLSRSHAPVMELRWDLVAPPGFLLRNTTPDARSHGSGLQVRRRLLDAEGDQDRVQVDFRFLSPRAQELSRLLALLVGLGVGWLLSALLAGSLPLVAGLVGLTPWVLAAFLSEPQVFELCWSGIWAALSLGLVVGLRRAWDLRGAARAEQALEQAAILERVRGLRERLSAAIAALPPLPESEATPEGETADEPEPTPEATEPEATPEGETADEPEPTPEATEPEPTPEATDPEPDPPEDPAPPPGDTPPETDSGRSRKRSKSQKGRKR